MSLYVAVVFAYQRGLLCLSRVTFLVPLLIFVALSVSLNAQSTRPDRGTGKGPQQVTDLDDINLQNGSVSMDIPLASLPPMAGGKLGYTLTAHYNSNLWNVWRSENEGDVNGGLGCPEIYTTGMIGQTTAYPWTIGAGYEIIFKDAYFDDFSFVVPESFECGEYEYYYMQGRFFRPVLKTPDGGEHEMRIDGSWSTYGGSRGYLGNYYQYSSSYPNQVSFSSPTRFYTVDGTYFAAIVNPSSYTTKWTVWSKDGTKIEQTASKQSISDTNGNSIEFGIDATYGFNYAKDLYTGRLIKWFATTYNGNSATQVQYQSTGGSWQSVYVTWGTTTPRGMAYSTTIWDSYLEQTCTVDQIIPSSPIDVVREIEFPKTDTESGYSAPKYQFAYNSDTSSTVSLSSPQWSCSGSGGSYSRTVSYGWGQLSSVTTPGGAIVSYEYASDGQYDYRAFDESSSTDGAMHAQIITEKSILHDSITDTWTYAIYPSVVGGPSGATVTGPDGSTTEDRNYPTDPNYPWMTGTDGQSGLVYKSFRPGGILIEKHWTLLGGNSLYAYGSYTNKVTYNPVVDTEYTTLLDTDGTTRLKMTAKTFTYDYNGDLTSTTEYDWINLGSVTYTNSNNSVTGIPTAIPSGTSVLRVTNNSYYNTASSSSSSTAYHKRTLGSSPVILGKPSETTVGTSSTTKSDTKFCYDGNSWGTVPSVGNLTKVSAYNDTTSAWIDTTSTYGTNGNVTATTDGNVNTTSITYGSVGGYSNLYPTQVVQASGTGVARTMQTGYDFYTGLVTSVTDYDNSVTNTTDYDIKLRSTLVKNAYGSALENWVQSEYHDHDRFVVSKTDLVSASDGKKVATQFFDQMGRVRLSKTLENASTQSATNETDGIKVESKYAYTSGYTWQLTSNPFRASSSSSAGSEETMGWTRTKQWATGRESQVETFSGATLPYPFLTSGYNTNSTGVVDNTITAETTTVTDQASKVRRSIADSLGRLLRVDEPTTSGLGSVSSPNQYTGYTYDVLNNLTAVSQGSQSRSFSYNSLSRLTSATNPESGTVSYSYDSNGNLTSKTDARSITTSYSYDALNRVTQRSYNDSVTPTVNYTYDNKTNAYGQLTKVSSSVSATEYTSFDVLGRVTGQKQTMASTDYTTSYTYNLGGELLTETYPSGRVVQNTFASNGDLSQVETKPSGGSYTTRASNFVYNPAGAAQSLQLGNGKYETTHFNPRLQPTQIGLGTSTTDTSLLKLENGYGTTANNGNVLSQEITVPGLTPHFIQSYTYDELNRVTSATETYNGSQTWKQEFSYDRYGNRNFVTGSGHTTTLGSCTTLCNPTFSSTTNRITSSGYSYDSNGNVTADPSPSGKSYTYDAENKQTQVTNGGSTLGTYYYDGDGRRVKKTASTGDNDLFIYDATGKLIEERDTSGNLQTSYVYAASKLLSTEVSSTTTYLTTDHLGSPRINTNGSGGVVARHDYLPFGEEILTALTSQRTSGVGYVSDSVRKQFTGYERDSETDLDFAQARYYAKNSGRFNSSDPLLSSGRSESPKTWNRYTYALNNPLRFVDPSGLDGEESNQTETQKIYVFVFLTKDEQTRKGKVDGKRIDVILPPDFDSLKKMAPKGKEVVYKGADATLKDFTDALQDKNAAGVVFIGHGSGDPGENFSAKALLIDPKSEPEATSEYYGEDYNKVDVKASLVAIFGCAVDKVTSAFEGASSIIAEYGGTKGHSENSAATWAGFTAAKAIISGKNPDEVTAQANAAFLNTNRKMTIKQGRTDIKFAAVPTDGDAIVRMK